MWSNIERGGYQSPVTNLCHLTTAIQGYFLYMINWILRIHHLLSLIPTFSDHTWGSIKTTAGCDQVVVAYGKRDRNAHSFKFILIIKPGKTLPMCSWSCCVSGKTYFHLSGQTRTLPLLYFENYQSFLLYKIPVICPMTAEVCHGIPTALRILSGRHRRSASGREDRSSTRKVALPEIYKGRLFGICWR